MYWKTLHKIKKQIEEEEDRRSRKQVSNMGQKKPRQEWGGFVCGSEPGYHQGPLQEAGDFSELRPQRY